MVRQATALLGSSRSGDSFAILTGIRMNSQSESQDPNYFDDVDRVRDLPNSDREDYPQRPADPTSSFDVSCVKS